MVNCVAVCGDSFGTGSGLPPETCYEHSFGGMVAENLGLPLKIFARSGSCNFAIYLQVKTIIQQVINKQIDPFVIITTTHHSRLFFPIDGTVTNDTVQSSMIDYLSYNPYSPNSSPQRPVEFKLDDKPSYISETVSNLNLCLAGHINRNHPIYDDIMPRKWNAIKMYFEELYDDNVKMQYDVGLIQMMHHMLSEFKIPHVILGWGKDHHFKYINPTNFIDIMWGKISKDYPDNMGSGHCNEIGHSIVANAIMPYAEALLKAQTP